MWNFAPATSPFGGERHRGAEDRAASVDLGDACAELGARDLAVLARRRDRRRIQLRRDVVRGAERARAARELLVERGDDGRVGRDRRHVRREERDVVARSTLNFDESKVPSLPNTTAYLPCAFSCWAKSCVCDASWNGGNTTFVAPPTLATSDEKSVAFWLIDSRSTVTPPVERRCRRCRRGRSSTTPGRRRS